MPFVMSLAEVATRQLEGIPWVPRYCGSGRHEVLVFCGTVTYLKGANMLGGHRRSSKFPIL